jgi:hypothetical protein
MWCIQTINSEYRRRKYDVLDLYEEEYDPKRPLICLDEKQKQLIEDKRMPIPIKPGSPEYDGSSLFPMDKMIFQFIRVGFCEDIHTEQRRANSCPYSNLFVNLI